MKKHTIKLKVLLQWVIVLSVLGVYSVAQAQIAVGLKVNASQATGVVSPVSSSANHISIRDNNSQKYDIWYSVSASCGGSTIYTDPRIENGGNQ